MSSSRKMKVLVVDDHLIVREGLRSTLRKYPFIRIVGEAKDGLEAMEKVGALLPDVVLMDINMPRMNGLEATAQIRKSFPAIKVLVITVHDSRQYVTQLLQAGAHGYVLKDAAPDELARAIQAVFNGEAFLSTAITQHVVDLAVQPQGSTPTPARITDREKQILSLLTVGKTNKEIAAHLDLSVRSVETFRLRLMRKLNVHNAAELSRYAVEHQLLT